MFNWEGGMGIYFVLKHIKTSGKRIEKGWSESEKNLIWDQICLNRLPDSRAHM